MLCIHFLNILVNLDEIISWDFLDLVFEHLDIVDNVEEFFLKVALVDFESLLSNLIPLLLFLIFLEEGQPIFIFVHIQHVVSYTRVHTPYFCYMIVRGNIWRYRVTFFL